MGLLDLRSWLRRHPKPRKLRVTTGDDETKVFDLGIKRVKWNQVEESVRACHAVQVEALDADDQVIRAVELEDASDGEKTSPEEKAAAKANANQAAMLDAYGKRLVEAFEKGAEAASASSDSLITLVSTLTTHLGAAITNLHTVSVNLANVISSAADPTGENKNAHLLEQVLALAVGKAQENAKNGKAKTP